LFDPFSQDWSGRSVILRRTQYNDRVARRNLRMMRGPPDMARYVKRNDDY